MEQDYCNLISSVLTLKGAHDWDTRNSSSRKDTWAECCGEVELNQEKKNVFGKSLLADNTILHTENPKVYTHTHTCTHKLFEWINEFSKVTRNKINIWRSVVFLYTKSKLSEKEIKKIISFTMDSKRIKYLGIKLQKKLKTYTLKLHNTDERNERHKYMERYPMFMDYST